MSAELPPLPERAITKQYDSAGNWYDCHPYYTAEQMHTYARTAVAAERALLNDELERFRNGYQGSCYACEPVGELNQKLRAQIAELQKLLAQEQNNAQIDAYMNEYHPGEIANND